MPDPRLVRVCSSPRPRGGQDGHEPAAYPAATGVMTRREFLDRVNDALEGIPQEFRDALTNVAIVVEDEPSPGQLDDAGVDSSDTLLGLYEGTPLPERHWAHGNTLPDKVTLFQAPIEDSSASDEDVVIAIGETLIHELGHYFGLSEAQIEAIEEEYWRAHGFEADDDRVE